MVKRNHFLLTALVAAAVIAGFLYWASSAKIGADSGESNNEGEPVVMEASSTSLAALGKIGDTPEDTLRTLTASLSQNNSDKAEMALALQRTQDELALQETSNTNQINALTTRFEQQMAQLEQKLSQNWGELKDRQLPIAIDGPELEQLGITSDREDDSDETWSTETVVVSTELVWTEPLDAKIDKDGNWSSPIIAGVKAIQQGVSDMDTPFDANQQDETPLYTLHRGAILSNATALTALMGRIPVNGQVISPYPFSMVIGAKNLLANGFTLPDVQGAIITGTATGDWSLSCVRGVVESIDFIRTDGAIVSYPKEQGAIDSSFDGKSVQTQDLGYLADPNGNPCLTGIRISNATQYLTAKGLLDAATAAANAAATSQQTISMDGSTSTSALTGSALKNAAGESAAALTGSISEFVQERMGSSFDIIYVEPGVQAAVHLRQPITLSLPHVPYRVRYEASSQGASYALP